MQMARRALALLVVLLGGAAAAGTKILQNDTFTGSGSVNAGVNFGEYQGAAVMFEPAASEYPLKIIAIDVLCVPYMNNGSGVGAYELDLWDESGGTVGAPRPTPYDGGGYYYGRVSRQGVQLTTSLGQFNRFTLQSPVTVTSGKVFVKLSQQTQTSFDNTTIALDLASSPRPGRTTSSTASGTSTPSTSPTAAPTTTSGATGSSAWCSRCPTSR